MHYKTKYCTSPIEPIDEFLALIDGVYPVEKLDTNFVSITPSTERKVIVLSYEV